MVNELTDRIPVIKLWNNIVVPLQGEISDHLARRLSEEVLTRLHTTGASGLVLDVTGVWLMDSHLCSVLSRIAEAAALIGTRTIISGLTPDIAITLQSMGAELRGASTALTLEEALNVLGVSNRESKVRGSGAAVSTPVAPPRAGPLPPSRGGVKPKKLSTR